MLSVPANHDSAAIPKANDRDTRGATSRTGSGASNINDHNGRIPVPKKNIADDATIATHARIILRFKF